MVPGGFSQRFGEKRPNRHGSVVSDEVTEAANRVLNDRRMRPVAVPSAGIHATTQSPQSGDTDTAGTENIK
jgi:hypothetical protein